MPEDSAINRREKQLYSTKYKDATKEREIKLSSRTAEIPSSWGGKEGDVQVPLTQKESSFSLFFFLISFLILALASSFLGWKFFTKNNTVTPEKINILLPDARPVEGGESFPFEYTVQNNNSLPLLSAQLVITYEKGTGAEDERNKVREVIPLGNIEQGNVKKGEITVQLFGTENETRSIQAVLEYKVGGLNSTSSKTSFTSFTLKTSPIAVHLTLPDKIVPLQVVPITLSVKNNTSTSSGPILLQAVLPPSFVLKSLSENAISKNTVWLVQPLASGEEKQITLQGSFKASVGEPQSVRVLVGSVGSQGNDIGNVYASDVKEVHIINPGLTLSLTASHEFGGFAESSFIPGERVRASVTYTNTTEEAVRDVQVVLGFKGAAIDPKTVTVENGLYDSEANTITWNAGTVDALKSVSPKGSGTFQVTFLVPSSVNTSSSFSIDTGITGHYADDLEVFTSKDTKVWNIEGGANITSSTLYKDTTFTNTGPLPPVANKETKYTLSFTVYAQNGFKGGKLVFSLPAYVTWLNMVSFGQDVVYDTRTRIVTWKIPDAGVNEVEKMNIQVSVKPSQTHVGMTPAVTSGISFDATDAATGTSLKRTLPNLTTYVQDKSDKDISTVVGLR